MKEFNKYLNGGIAHLKPFPGSKAKQMDHHVIPILEQHQYDAAVIHVGINDLLKRRTNINASQIAKDIINIALRCRSHNIAIIFISSIVYSTKVSHTIIQKLNELLLNECTKYDFHLVDNGAVSKVNLWKDGVHLVESGKAVIANNLLNCINNFFRSCKFSSADRKLKIILEKNLGKIYVLIILIKQIRLGIHMAI